MEKTQSAIDKGRHSVLSRNTMWFMICLLPLVAKGVRSSVCGPVPDSFVDVGNSLQTVTQSWQDEIQLAGDLMTYHVFDVIGFVTGVIWHNHGSVELKSFLYRDDGLFVHIVSTDWTTMTNLTGTIFFKHTNSTTDLAKIDGYICDDYSPEEAMVITFDCLRQGDGDDFPKARYQIVLVIGHDSNGQEKSYILIITDVLPGDAWDSMSSAPYRYYLRYGTEYYPIPVTANSVLAIDVTSKQTFTPDVEPDIASPPCKVTCSITRAGTVTTFSGDNGTTLSGDKFCIAEWNPPHGECKFKFVANFKGGYKRSFFNVGPHVNANKYFRVIDFDKYPGQVSQRGWKCTASCRGVITSFPHEISDTNANITYATVNEVEAGSVYTITTELCSQPSEPYYKFTYDFSATDDQPLATLEIAEDFYTANKDQMSGVCVSNSA